MEKNSKGIVFLLDDKYSVYKHLFMQAMILLITIGVFFDTPDTLNLSFNRFCGWITYFLFMNMLVYTNVYVLFPHFLARGKVKQYAISVVLFTVFALLVLIILQNYFYDIAVVHHQPSTMAIFLSISSSFLAIILFIGGMSALLLFKPIVQTNMRMRELKTATIRSELQFLKSQINPHFLFNTINNANILVEDEPELATNILTKLDRLLKYQLEDSQKEKVYLKDDIKFLSDYLDLERIRRDQFEFSVKTDSPIDSITIPPLLFIPFVENAVKHNSNSNGLSYVNLIFRIEDDILIFICENSKAIVPAQKEIGGIGLTNITRRLELLYKNNYTLNKNETELQYTAKLILKI